ncbi:signal peptidase I [Leucobacter sp. OLJS4]|uniref:signal peptidase I n=1 Tax=unclassified Leucobacter TaxID=2621730 RepID=UPI000C1A5983|nr:MULTISPECIES: signal peptidase I [unclassified Leucobacter]PII85086.1 signal peptidase I [Leucobacter sp. OLCALW19]PII89097.1 signal peptidase I [Leucobacter sp. OLTLW20]PII93497.1 signal peptidase I [Leucobacter sp. OLAS13]PII98108.1 signal peptidase I [Leucobacter sp. OLDS2]PIJ02597.1 signal peptidase I [Leucobacter sp. OLCS4]
MQLLDRFSRGSARRVSSTKWFDTPWRIAGRAIASALIAVVVIVILALAVVPRLLGGDSLTVLTGSMEPTFSPGDVVVVKGVDKDAVCTDIPVGAVVTYFPKPDDPDLITHRVVGKTIGTFDDGTRCRLITQGDANSAVDAPVSPAQVRGTLLFGVPKLGWARQWVGDNMPIVLTGAAVVLIGWGLWGAFRRPKQTIVSVPRPQGVPNPEGAAPTAPAAAPQRSENEARELELRERELQIREREIELRERELAFVMSGSGEQPGDGTDDGIPR